MDSTATIENVTVSFECPDLPQRISVAVDSSNIVDGNSIRYEEQTNVWHFEPDRILDRGCLEPSELEKEQASHVQIPAEKVYWISIKYSNEYTGELIEPNTSHHGAITTDTGPDEFRISSRTHELLDGPQYIEEIAHWYVNYHNYAALEDGESFVYERYIPRNRVYHVV